MFEFIGIGNINERKALVDAAIVLQLKIDCTLLLTVVVDLHSILNGYSETAKRSASHGGLWKFVKLRA